VQPRHCTYQTHMTVRVLISMCAFAWLAGLASAADRASLNPVKAPRLEVGWGPPARTRLHILTPEQKLVGTRGGLLKNRYKKSLL
jgi:hypothetical protein